MSEPFRRPLLDVLAELRRGRTAAEGTDHLHDLIAAVRDTGKGGTLTIKLDIAPADTGEEMLRVTDTVTVKKPIPAVKPSLFFVSDDGNLTRTNPLQEQFSGMRALDGTTDDTPTTERKTS